MGFFLKGLDALNDVQYKNARGIRRVTGTSDAMESRCATARKSPVNPWEQGDAA